MRKYYYITIVLSLLFIPLSAAADSLLWSYTGCNGVYNSADLGDVDDDGIPDVVCGKYYSDEGDELFALSGADGTKIWEANDCLGIWGTKSLDTVADLDDDGMREVIMGTPGGVSEGRSFYLKSGVDGTTIFTYSTYSGPNAGWVYAVAGIEDVNNNGKADLLAGVGGNTGDRRGTVICFDGGSTAGSVDILWTFRPQYDGVQCLAVIGDVTGDGIDEVVFGSGGNGYDNQVYCLNGATGVQEWKTPDTGDSIWDVINVGDLNDDGYDDVAAGNWDGEVIAFSGFNGAQLWSEDVTTVVMDLERLPDVDADGYDDIVVGHWGSQLICMSGDDGSIIWSEPIATNLWNVDVVEDFDGDGLWEAVGGALATGSGSAKVFSGDEGDELWSESYTERVYDVESVGDMNGDGISEVCVCLQDKGHEAAHVFLYNVADGYVDIDEEDSGDPFTPSTFELHQSRPNPCSGTAVISFALTETAFAALSVYDIKGRRIDTLIEDTLEAGEHEVSVSGLSPGIYLYQLRAGDNEAVRKMVVK